MQLERKALYNSLRMNWLTDQSIPVEPWQVEDYRSLPLQSLFDKLKQHHFSYDKHTFALVAEPFDSPEDMLDHLLDARHPSAEEEDQIYLILFEIWRRLIPEKQALSVFCDELDHVIYQYDHNSLENNEAVQDILVNLQLILDQNADEGSDPQELWRSISACSANNLETFLYDYISEQIDLKNESYATELLEGFIPYVDDDRWFEFLKVRIQAGTDEEGAMEHLATLFKETQNNPDLEFNLEVLDFLAKGGYPLLFKDFLKKTLPLIKLEEDFQDVLNICIIYFNLQDNDKAEIGLTKILEKRADKSLDAPFTLKSSDAEELVKIINDVKNL